MTYAVFGVLTEMVLRLGRYTFDGNALPRPQLGDESAGQLIGYAKFPGWFARQYHEHRREVPTPQASEVTTPSISRTVGKPPEGVVYARQPPTSLPGDLLGKHDQFGGEP
jgi:hypothetical protein